jgi:DNA-binding NtrC family response regulator
MRSALVVDDEEVVALFVEELLTDEGFVVQTAGSGGDGLAKLADGTVFDLVIADKNLPDMSGIDLLREIVARTPRARVVIVTAYGSIESALEALKAGAADYVLKPIDDVETFLARVRRALERPPADRAALERLEARDLPPGMREALEAMRGLIETRA